MHSDETARENRSERRRWADPKPTPPDGRLYYVMDSRDRRPLVGNALTRFPDSTFTVCEKAINFYRDMEYPDFPYSIVDARTGDVVGVYPLDETDAEHDYAEYVRHSQMPPEEFARVSDEPLASVLLDNGDVEGAYREIQRMWERLARHDAIIDAQPTEMPNRQELILRWIELGYVRGAAIEEGNREYAILKAKWELAEALRKARDE